MNSNKLGCVLHLFIAHENKQNKLAQKCIEVDSQGIKNDKFYGKDENRSILLTSKKAYDLMSSNNIQPSYGELGENILIDFDPYNIEKGSLLAIGDTTVQITQDCTICGHLKKIDSCVPKMLKNDRGVFVKVIKGGTINSGDEIKILN